ncbi:hypothetical protein AX17_006680 [Amanita inopinata Kibby_2008]|nr:hypothetical protein AX17_006680 [Amanita inopinata Kibby_2008]
MVETVRHALEPTSLSATETVRAVDTAEPQEQEEEEEEVVYSSPKGSPTGTQFLPDNDGSPQVMSPQEDPGSFSKPPPVRREKPMSSGTMPLYIPHEHRGTSTRMLILCFDGTGDQFDADNSNIVQLVSMLKKDDKTKQMVYYQAGIGTYISPSVATPFMSKLSKMLDEMFAWNLNAHVMSGYEFLMQNYVAGDKICIFGFSRGAYTARSLAGMIHKVGLLPADNFQQVPFAYKMFTRADTVGWEQSNAFKQAFSVDVPIEFIGVWDTVDSVGLIPKRLPFTTSNTIVRTFRHAISLDEHRAKFKANFWNRPTDDEERLGSRMGRRLHSRNTQRDHADHDHGHGHDDNDDDDHADVTIKDLANGGKKSNGGGHNGRRGARLWTMDDKSDRAMNQFEYLYSGQQMTDVEEVWFAGCHCDVGGGSVKNGTRYSLARIPLRWMIRECFKTNTGIMFKTEALRQIGLDPTTLYPFVAPRPPPLSSATQTIERPATPSLARRVKALVEDALAGSKGGKKRGSFVSTSSERSRGSLTGSGVSTFISEEDEELRDALSPKYDQLKLKRSWWVLEVMPLTLRYQKGNNEWVSYVGLNLAKPRFIPKQHSRGVKVHRSVKVRMEAAYAGGKKYKPKPDICVEPTWID